MNDTITFQIADGKEAEFYESLLKVLLDKNHNITVEYKKIFNNLIIDRDLIKKIFTESLNHTSETRDVIERVYDKINSDVFNKNPSIRIVIGKSFEEYLNRNSTKEIEFILMLNNVRNMLNNKDKSGEREIIIHALSMYYAKDFLPQISNKFDDLLKDEFFWAVLPEKYKLVKTIVRGIINKPKGDRDDNSYQCYIIRTIFESLNAEFKNVIKSNTLHIVAGLYAEQIGYLNPKIKEKRFKDFYVDYLRDRSYNCYRMIKPVSKD